MKKLILASVAVLTVVAVNAQLSYSTDGKLVFGNTAVPDANCATAWEGAAHYYHSGLSSVGGTWMRVDLSGSSPCITSSDNSIVLQNPASPGKGLEFSVVSGNSFISAGGGSIYFHDAWPNNIYAGRCYTFSDGREASDLAPLAGALGIVGKMRPKTYTDTHGVYAGLVKPTMYGLMGEDLDEVVPSAVSRGNPSNWYVDYAQIVSILVKAVQELEAIVAAQDARIRALESKTR